jgi:hypothetical protein
MASSWRSSSLDAGSSGNSEMLLSLTGVALPFKPGKLVSKRKLSYNLIDCT